VIPPKGILAAIPWHESSSEAPQGPTPASEPGVGLNRRILILRQESVNALMRTLSARDPYTGHHANRVTNVALAFGRSLGLPAQDLEALATAGYLHDIGKVGISDSILLKPGPLTAEERAVVETHPLIGAKIVEPLGLRPQEKNIILLHHERWDGLGYPYNLSGVKIPFLCRLLALADVFDALTSDRPYRRALTVSKALAEIDKQAGKHFDPDLATQFILLIDSYHPHTLTQIPPPPWLTRSF
jgi:putative nucleotidyltransferase with HDIG domain